MAKRQSKPPQWQAAVVKMQAARSRVEDAINEYNEAQSELKAVQEEYQNWLDNLPENLQGSALGEKLETVCGIDLDSELEVDFDSLDEAESVDLPRGFGRD